MRSKPTILLTFDVEEFDLPLEYKAHITDDEAMAVGKQGLDIITPLIANIPVTLFTTANFADHFPESIRSLAQKNEIASHAYYHGSFKKEDLLHSRTTLERISGTKVTGLRMPRLREIDMASLKDAGYAYDSSINPTYIPGRYNNRHLPRTVYSEDGMIRLPVSVSPRVRFPLFWLSFKNIPYPVYKKIALKTLRKDGYLSLYFHPWEFTELSGYPLPFYLTKKCGSPLVKRLKRLIEDLGKEGEFKTVTSFLNSRGLV